MKQTGGFPTEKSFRAGGGKGNKRASNNDFCTDDEIRLTT